MKALIALCFVLTAGNAMADINYIVPALVTQPLNSVLMAQSGKTLAIVHKDGTVEIHATEQELREFGAQRPTNKWMADVFIEILRLRAKVQQ